MKRINTILLALLTLGMSSCNYLDVEPVGKVIPEKTSEFRALLTSGYSTLPSYKKLLSVRADELFPRAYTPTYSFYIDIALLKDQDGNSDASTYPWQGLYKAIFYANSVIDGVMGAEEDSREDSPAQLKGEALLLRAYVHFELLNLYARPYNKATAAADRGIPLALEIDINQKYILASVEKVYEQVLADIAEALPLLDVEVQPAAVRYRFSRKAAVAFEARVRLYRSEWEQALAAAQEILPDCKLENLNDAAAKAPYKYDSEESILAMELTNGTDLQDDASVLPNVTGKYPDEGDLRLGLYFRSSWGEYRLNKCYDKSMRVSFRSGELYLIAAEAAAHINGKLSDAKGYFKQLAKNRLTPDYYEVKAPEIDAMNAEQLIAEIADERVRELTMEGHRWYDLRRTTRPKVVKTYMDTDFVEQEVVIEENDSRYTIPFPREATESNPELANWK